jgi:hypothetical protein
MTYWRIRHFINGSLTKLSGAYLEVGIGTGNFEKIDTRRKKLVKELTEVDAEEKFSVIFLREPGKDIADQVKFAYQLLNENGLIILGYYGERGLLNDAWRVTEALKKKKIVSKPYKGYYLIYNSGELKGNLRSSMKLENYLKRFEV